MNGDFWMQMKSYERLAACIDVMVHRGVLDARSIIADARLQCGSPYAIEKAEKLMMETRPNMERK